VKRRPSEDRPATPDSASDADADPRVASFLRGVTIGALVGAAIAGSALWERAVRRREQESSRPGPDEGNPSA
jgi:hypothetical protein